MKKSPSEFLPQAKRITLFMIDANGKTKRLRNRIKYLETKTQNQLPEK